MPEEVRKRILVVDDEEIVRDLYSRLLTINGYEVHRASDGKEAFRRVNRIAYDLIHMDIRMPDWDGVDATIAIGLVKPDIPILVVSGVLTDDVINELEKECNVRGWMEKPTGVEAYLSAVRSILYEYEIRGQTTPTTPTS